VKLLDRAIELHGEQLIDDHIKSASNNGKNLGGDPDRGASGQSSRR